MRTIEGIARSGVIKGPGYRLYFTKIGKAIVLLLIDGDEEHAGYGHCPGNRASEIATRMAGSKANATGALPSLKITKSPLKTPKPGRQVPYGFRRSYGRSNSISQPARGATGGHRPARHPVLLEPGHDGIPRSLRAPFATTVWDFIRRGMPLEARGYSPPMRYMR
ncbi:MAG: hypothetical protein J2P54_01125 [Bradyrhizobiaceae bacterium]|nr:hypothetical protein [Bradyrhizobiaceae bacterium]